MSQITTHVLDTALGKPAQKLPVRLYQRLPVSLHQKLPVSLHQKLPVSLHQKAADEWQLLAKGVTNHDGRFENLLSKTQSLVAGDYRMHFDTGSYFAASSITAFYPFVDIVFTVSETELEQHYHIPLLLSPYGYSTYRGS